MEYAVEFNNVIKEYKLYKNDKDRFKDLFWGKRYTPYRAINNLSVKFEKGEVIGIFGKNGSGKSTLLKIVTGVVYPTWGTVEVNGAVSALLELTAGFDGELTGRENIYLKGYTMGYTRSRIHPKVEEIIEFSELGEYIDQPVRMYSSGMKARLGFAIAVNVDPEILVVDEALAVGDEDFRQKCLNRMDKFRDEGKTILFVSHSVPQMRSFCTKGVWLHKGEMIVQGDIDEVANMYKHFLNGVDIDTILRNKEKYKELVEIKQSVSDVELIDGHICLKGFVKVEPENKEFTIKSIDIINDDTKMQTEVTISEDKEDGITKDYEIKIPVSGIKQGYYNANITLEIEGEIYERQLWLMYKMGQFADTENNISLIIKNNRLKIKKD